MRLKHLVAVGIALFFVMPVVHGDEIASGESSSIAIVLVIDNSKSVNDLDKDGERFAKAMSFIGFLNNSTHVVGLVSTLGNNRGGREYICKDPTRNFDQINKTLLDIKSESERFPMIQQHKITNINEFIIRATELLENNKFNCMKNITIFFSDGVPNDGIANVGYNNSTLINIEEKTWIYTIGIGNDSTGIEILKEISYSTQSKFYHLGDSDPVILLRDINSRINSNIAFIDVNKTADPSSGPNGTLVNFTINVTNTGEIALNSVIVNDTLPLGLEFVSDNMSGSPSVDGHWINWTLDELGPGNSTDIELVAQINGEAYGTLWNEVNVTGISTTGETLTDNDTEPVEAKNSSIEVNKTADPSSGPNSTLVNFSINVTNTGNATLKPVTVTDTLPEGLDYVSSTDNGTNSRSNVTWELGELNASESRSIYLEARINRSESGVLTNFVLVDGKPESGYNVSENATWNVTVLPPNGTFILFALDTSGSMKKYYRLAPNESAEIVSTWSHFGNATVSIVSWDHRIALLFGPAPLAGNEGIVAGVLDNLSGMCIETDLTFYDEGLNGSLAVLRDYSDEANGSAKIIVFLTGFSEFEPGSRLDGFISEASESGYKIFTIGLGIERNFSASERQYLHLTKISEGTGGEFQAALAFSSGELKTVMETIANRVEIPGIPAEPRSG